MKIFFKKLATFLGKTWVWTLLLVLLAALAVWFFGPLLAVDDQKFWEDASSRLLSISVLFLAWGLFIVYDSWRSTRRKNTEAESADGKGRLLKTLQMEEDEKRLRKLFKKAVRTLKTASLYRGRSERWRDELPWYLLIGPEGSGKSSLLKQSGLEFPLNNISSETESGDSNYCEWYFGEHGVLVDTAARYLTHTPDTVESHSWKTLLGLLRTRRRNRPLNGLIITVPMELLEKDPDGLMKLADSVRERLKDIRKQLRVDLPVYLVISKADKIQGFEAFFEHLSREESDQVLGASFAKGQSGNDREVIRHEFEELLRRLNSQVITRMQQEQSLPRRALVFDFPHKLGKIGQGLTKFIAQAFGGNRYERAGQLRGFYLTSASPTGAQTDAYKKTAGIETFNGSARFINHLLSRVIFPEAELAGLNKRERRRIHWGQRALYVTSFAALGLFGLLWALGFSANHGRLEQLREFAQNLTKQHVELAPQDDAMAALQVLDTGYAASRVFPALSDVQLHERSGLYQGELSHPVLDDAYQRELQKQLLPRVARTLEAQVRANMNDRERLLGSLRAYLMLNLTERRDSTWLKDWVATDWSMRYMGNTSVQNSLGEHFSRLLAHGFTYPLNDALVAQARQVLQAESQAAVVYRSLREQAKSLPDYRVSQHLGPQGAVFRGTDYLIPGFYTQRGYQQFFTTQGASLVNDILRDNWVLGESAGISGMDLRRLMVELEQLYFRDYANHWGEAIGQISLQPFGSAGEGASQLAGLIAANSPLLQLLVEVRDNTRFPDLTEGVEQLADAAGDAGGKLGALGKVAAAAAGQAQGALAKSLPDTAKKSMQRRFEPLHQLLDANNGPAPELMPTLQALNDLQLQVATLARSSQPDQAAYEMAKLRMNGQRDALNSLRGATSRLPRPISGWLDVLAEDTWMLVLSDAYQYLNQRYQSELHEFYSKALHQRYPFNAHSTSDVAISDFREFFKAQGVADRFFDNYMRPFVSGTPGNYRLRSIDGRSLPMSRLYLVQMGHVQVIRQSFFAHDPNEPQVQFKLEPYTLDPTVSRAEFRFGNQQLEYRHGPIVPMSFTWPTDAEDGRTSLVLEKMVGRPIGIEKNTGPWSLFRLLDLMQTEYLKGRDVMVLKADVGGLRANYLLLAQRSPNPFDVAALRSFRLPAQL
ncbi:type VI secretion system membrane subunit TssM [Pseudomonas sp. CCI3.2]|uniref:type VI secretion system membrane subunit TssM n=1 Tax=unclassified Pseudomonas TaxID=196821 RepID=UPI002AC9732E|nr:MULTISPECIES: type VI secretion system membrane subunit TssM [unclassified Pseudomonas]MEB0079625.1 type VI secretion system membrane subunit TssM [Pseudomonas sp. MH10out]MEB0103831.1 type VI secretion system membrane subunit TssM [Pseudomonas sp. CCI3.2]MEB0133081.1 type VI secretion system membrane subunit TssM [Pseudomonas sp. CCI2.4]MEB0157806.1 type VI secretion system membrane subunit TssM [Pseudomonas sp. AH2 (2023)]MEB0169347.1 type VI secretion system membrane subunit TssM [Pseudo